MPTKTLTILSIAGLLAGCATAPAVPYWQNPQWINALARTVHSNIRYPKDAAKDHFPYGTAIVVFTYYNDKLLAPRILKSTGSSFLDSTILEQITAIIPPQADGLNTEMPHNFQMEISIYPPYQKFFSAIKRDLAVHIQYMREDVLAGASGMVLADFKYRNGEVIDAQIVKSSGIQNLDKAVLHELQTISFPQPPYWFKDKTFSFQVPFCFGMTKDTQCQHFVMQVRYIPVNERNAVSKPPCAEIGYRYEGGKITNVHLIASSGNSDWDKRALKATSERQLPHPPSNWNDVITDYSIPVCNNSGSAIVPSTTRPY